MRSEHDGLATGHAMTSAALPSSLPKALPAPPQRRLRPPLSAPSTSSASRSSPRPPLPPPPSSSWLSRVVEWFLDQLGLADLVSVPPFIFSRAFLSSPTLYFALSFVFFPLVLTQSFNRIRSTSLLSYHSQLGWVWIARSRWDQSIAESWAVLFLIMAMAAAVIALNVQVLERGPYLTVSAESWREEEERERRREAAAPPLPPDKAAEDRDDRQFRCVFLLALLLVLAWVLRYMANMSAPPHSPPSQPIHIHSTLRARALPIRSPDLLFPVRFLLLCA